MAAQLLYSGTCGGCSWEINDAGLLRIYPINGVEGTLSSGTNPSDWPWDSYRESVKKVIVENGVKGNSRCGGIFYYTRNCIEMDLSNFDTSSVTNMQAMFYYCNSLTSLDLSGFDTSSVTDMRHMFSICNSLTSLDLSNFDTSSVTSMQSMFYSCNSLTSLDLSNFDTSSVTNMQYMFASYNGEPRPLPKLSKIVLGNTFKFVGSNHYFINTNWIKTFNVDGSATNSTTEYTGTEIALLTSTTIPSIGGTWKRMCTMNLVYIYDNAGEFSPYQVLINDGSDWNQYIPYIYTESGWEIYSGQ